MTAEPSDHLRAGSAAASTAGSAAISAEPTLSPPMRTLVSFLLFLHLFALAVVISSRASASPEGEATFEMLLRRTPLLEPYTQLLQMDLSYKYHLTYGPAMDGMNDTLCWFEVDLTDRDGTTHRYRLPDGSHPGSLREQYWGNLARRAVSFADDETQASQIPQAVAQRLVAEQGDAVRGVVRLRQSQMPLRAYEPVSGNAVEPYAARIVVARNRVSLSRITAAFEAAPAATTPTTGNTPALPAPTSSASEPQP